MIVKYFEYEIPTICLYYSSLLEDSAIFNEILWGIEEEGIPFKILNKGDSLSSEELSHMAAQDSKLAVGIGIDKDRKVTLTLNKLKIDKPLFTISLDDSSKELRVLGANAGRLVKGIAFK